jgi:adenine-specific DNA-methyltransferase
MDSQRTFLEIEENPDYLNSQLITYIGNKRALLDFIGTAIDTVKQRVGKKRIIALDLFSGSGIVARFLKRHAELLIANDLEEYSYVTNQCYLANRSSIDMPLLKQIHIELLHQLASEPLRGSLQITMRQKYPI